MTDFDRRTFLAGSAALAALATLSPVARAEAIASNFHAIYDDPRMRDRFFLFLQNVFHLFPEDRFHQLILDAVAAHDGDEAIYRMIQAGLPAIKPVGAEITYALPALKKQKIELSHQTALLLEDDDRKHFDGYLEIGTTGRYVKHLKERLPLEGDTFLVNDIAPGGGPIDILERGGFGQVGAFSSLGNYDRIDVPEGSLDLVTNFIGFHHAPLDRLEDFLDSIHVAMRSGGRLVVRDHDVPDAKMDKMVALAHDVFNAGVWASWETNAKELRHFRSKEEWQTILAKAGFKRADQMLAQAHDPTDNVLMVFTKV